MKKFKFGILLLICLTLCGIGQTLRAESSVSYLFLRASFTITNLQTAHDYLRVNSNTDKQPFRRISIMANSNEVIIDPMTGKKSMRVYHSQWGDTTIAKSTSTTRFIVTFPQELESKTTVQNLINAGKIRKIRQDDLVNEWNPTRGCMETVRKITWFNYTLNDSNKDWCIANLE